APKPGVAGFESCLPCTAWGKPESRRGVSCPLQFRLFGATQPGSFQFATSTGTKSGTNSDDERDTLWQPLARSEMIWPCCRCHAVRVRERLCERARRGGVGCGEGCWVADRR